MNLRLVKNLILTTILCVSLSKCAAKFQPEMPQPSNERIQQLLNLAPPKNSRQKQSKPKFELIFYPSAVMVGSAVWVTCYVPEDMLAIKINFGIEGLSVSGGQVDRIQNRLLIERVPCGDWTAFCNIMTGAGVKKLTRDLTVAGCDGRQSDRTN